MKKYISILLIILAFSCRPKIDTTDIVSKDSIIYQSKKIHDSIFIHLPNIDRKIQRIKERIMYRVMLLKSENESLKIQQNVVKTVVVKDTIYIKEKTNFWGKKRITKDSTQSIDSTIIENENN